MSPPRSTWLETAGEALLPWTRLRHGVYVDGLVTAIQRFDATSWDNENGIFAVLGWPQVRLTVRGPFKWPQPEARAVCAFQPTRAYTRLGPLAREWVLDGGGEMPFDDVPVTRLPFFRFLLVDECVAVAQGRSGSVAVWARVTEDELEDRVE